MQYWTIKVEMYFSVQIYSIQSANLFKVSEFDLLWADINFTGTWILNSAIILFFVKMGALYNLAYQYTEKTVLQ